MKFNTKAIHAGQQPDPQTGAVMPPIYQTSTYAQEAPNQHKGYDYARVGNPTRTALEQLIAGLEDANECAVFGSGCGAMDAVMKTLRPGDHVIASNDLYGGSYRLFTKVFEPFGIRFSFVDMTDLSQVEEAINKNTKLMWIETPTNPLLRVADIETLSDLASKNNIFTVVDNTFASAYLQLPLQLGADASLYSTTKYLGGHSDVIGGAIVSNDEQFMEKIRFQIKTTGAVPGPMDCFLTLRGIKTLHLRVRESTNNAKAITEFLLSHDKVKSVQYPGLESHSQHHIAKKQMKDFGGMISFTLEKDTQEGAIQFMQKTNIITLAESLGGVESLVSHPASMTHGSIPKEVREKAGLMDSLIRLSVGIEDVEDLIADIDGALS
mgnify:CR=1 FL=1